jgi:hypothetical protein
VHGCGRLPGRCSVSTDLTFITNKAGRTLKGRFACLLANDPRFFDCLVGYFFLSGFHRLYPHLENVQKALILVGLQTDHTAYDLVQQEGEHLRRELEPRS